MGAIGWSSSLPRCAGGGRRGRATHVAPSGFTYIHSAPPGARGPGAVSPVCAVVGWRGRPSGIRYLVDSASSHMLVSKIKPCMSKYKQFIR